MFRFRSILLLVSIFIATTLSASADSPSAEQIFPDATKGFISVRNLKDFGEQWNQTQFGQLMSDPLMQNFKKEVRKKLSERMEKTFGFSFDSIDSLPAGEAAFGMVALPEQMPGFVFYMDVADKQADFVKYLDQQTQKLTTAGVKKTTEAYKEQQITALIFPPPELPQTLGNTRLDITLDAVERHAYYMLIQNKFIASDQPHLLRLMADRLAGQSGKSLAEVEGFQVVMKRCLDDTPEGTKPILRWYIEPLDYAESARKLLPNSLQQKIKNKPSVASILKQQGFDALQGVGGMVSIKTEAQESVYRTFIHTKRPYRLAMQMLDFPEGTNYAPPVWMPADLARCTMFYVDLLAVFDNFGVLFDAFVMPGEEGVWKDILAGLEEDPHGPKINVRDELIAHLGNRVLGMSRYEKPITTKSESIVLTVELKEGHEPAMLSGIEKLFGTDPEMQGTPHRSYMIWHRIPPQDMLMPIDIDVPSLVDTPVVPKTPPPAPQNAPPVFPEGGVVVAKGCLFISTNIEYLKAMLDRLDTPAAQAPASIGNEAEYKEVDRIFAGMGLTDKPHFFQFFARTHETLRPTYEMIRLDQMAKSQALLGKLLNDLLSPDNESGVRQQILDGSTMPEFEKVQHYFGKVGIYGVSEDNGYFIKGFVLERDTK